MHNVVVVGKQNTDRTVSRQKPLGFRGRCRRASGAANSPRDPGCDSCMRINGSRAQVRWIRFGQVLAAQYQVISSSDSERAVWRAHSSQEPTAVHQRTCF